MASFLVAAGTVEPNRITMSGADDLTVESTGALSVSANAQAVRFTAPTNGAVINNNGTIEATGVQAEPRAIRFEDTVGPSLTATINNFGTIQSRNDAIGIQAGAVTSGQVTVSNALTISSIDGQAIDFAGGTGTFITDVDNSGTILSLNSDAIRIGGVGDILNFGSINGGSDAAYSGADGIQFEDNTTGTVINNDDAGGFISGDRHGINAGTGTVITVTNNGFGQITGRNGSGVGSDGSATVTNFGTITGAFSDSAGSDVNGPGGAVPDGINDGDGDGIDIDGQATIVNHGTIQGTGAGGHGSDGLPNTSEGIAAGGGTITNNAGATIIGVGLGILIDDSSQGPAPFQTTITNDGTITGTNSFGIKIVSTFNDVIVNNGTINGGGGTAILFGNGDDTLRIGASSVINGISDGGGGTHNTLDYSTFGAAGVTVNLLAGTATGTDGVESFQDVIGSTGNDFLYGDGLVNQLSGGTGTDWLRGGAGADTLDGGANGDFVDYSDKVNSVVVTLNGSTNATVTVGGVAEDTIRNIENIYGGAAGDVLRGDGFGNNIFGNTGNDLLKGGGGADTLDGAAGVDRADYSDKVNSVVVTLNGSTNATVTVGGVAEDTIKNIENLVGGAAGDILTGDGLANTLRGGGGADLLNGAAGVDTADYLDKAAAVVVTLNGAINATVTVGGVAEDTIRNIENLVGGAAGDTLTGDGLANTFRGGGGADLLNGAAGLDTADYGDKAAAVVVTLNGAANATVTVGGVAEDTVRNIENVIGGSAGDKLTGDGLANVLSGGAGTDTLKGGVGSDTLDGGANGDFADYRDKVNSVNVTLNGASDATVLVGGVAEDTVKNIENIYGGTAGDALRGDNFNNYFYGHLGNDLLSGGGGNDTLAGAAGADTFRFNTTLNAATNVDHIVDFATEDTIHLDDAVFTTLATGALAASAFHSAAGATSAADASDRIVYNTTTGALYYDADGLGGVAAVQFADLDNNAALTSADFFVV